MKIGRDRGKPIHVLTEKLMGWNITSCKKMIAVAKETGSILSVGHQRHYSMMYAHAAEVMGSGVLGDVKHIRALWHRNFSWPFAPESAGICYDPSITQPKIRDGWFNPIDVEDFNALKDKLSEGGLKGQFDSVEQLVRWRLYPETGGGLMAELGSHQLDACSIFLGKVHPLAVSGVGVKSFYGKGRNDRTIDDHVFVTLEFPGKNHPQGANKGNDPEDIVVVTYSSISTNGFEPYGECVMGTRGSMVVESEQKLMMFTEKDPAKKSAEPAKQMEVKVDAGGKGAPALAAASTWGGPAPVATGTPAGPAGTTGATISRGYREEMEDFAYCIRQWDHSLGYATDESKEGKFKYVQRLPRCHGEVAMADAIIALTSNKAMHDKKRIVFDDKWFELTKDEVEKKKYNVPDEDAKEKVPVE
jgi:predicted dehydrogenase